MSTRKQVADRAGVSEATVSRILNGVGPVKEETRQRVLAAASELGYQPSAIAQSFARGRSGNLGVVLPVLPKVHLFSTYYFSEILGGIGSAVQERGIGLLLLFREPGQEADYAGYFRTQRVDALVVLGASDSPEELSALRRLDQAGYPFAVVNQQYAEESFLEVDADHAEGSYRVVRHLLEQGARRIGLINGSLLYSNSRDRLAGYRRALEEAGLTPDPALKAEGNYSRRSGAAAAEQLRPVLDGLDAVFAANDRMAIGFMQAVRGFGYEPGRDLLVAGYDDADAASLTEPALTTVRVPFYEMGRLAAERVLQEADRRGAGQGRAEAGKRRLLLDTQLVVRASSGRALNL